MNEDQAARALYVATRFSDKDACRGAIYAMLKDFKGLGRLTVLQRSLVYSSLLVQVRVVLQQHVTEENVRDEIAQLLTDARWTRKS